MHAPTLPRCGAPLGFGTVILSGLQWVFRRYRYNHYQALARTTPRYKEALRKAAMEKEIAAGTAGDRQNKKKKKRRKPVTRYFFFW